MQDKNNKFSVVIPVRNGGDYLKEAIQSVLAQTYTAFDILIIESGSTDDSVEYVQSIKDERIKLFAKKESLGIEANWTRILQTPRNEFMTILGQDDILHPNYLEALNTLINNNPLASLYQTHFEYIDAKGNEIRTCQKMNERLEMADFLKSILENTIDVKASGFMMRTKDYDAIGGIPNYPNLLFADFELFLELTKKGSLAVLPESCFSFRLHQSTTTVSADEKFQKAFGQFVGYLEKLGKKNELYKKIIAEHGEHFVLFFCKGLAHRLIRTSKKIRTNITVEGLINNCKQYGKQLFPCKDFNPEKLASIKLAKWIDKYAIPRFLFLQYKRIYSKPVL